MRKYLWSRVQFSGCRLRRAVAESNGSSSSRLFWEAFPLISNVTESVYIPANSEWGFNSPHCLVSIYWIWLLDDWLAVLRVQTGRLERQGGNLHRSRGHLGALESDVPLVPPGGSKWYGKEWAALDVLWRQSPQNALPGWTWTLVRKG